MTPTTTVTWYVARNHLGQFNSGTCWRTDIADARLHRKPAACERAATMWVKNHPGTPVPEILEWRLDIATANVISVAGETEKRLARAAKAAIRAKEEARLRDLEYVGIEEKRLADKRARLEGRA